MNYKEILYCYKVKSKQYYAIGVTSAGDLFEGYIHNKKVMYANDDITFCKDTPENREMLKKDFKDFVLFCFTGKRR